MTELHPDFADLRVHPGGSHTDGRDELFDVVNVIAFGGAADRPTHVPAELGAVGPVSIWESTGAADSLPFWNTNLDGDQYLYVVHGSVRVEFKETEGDRRYGHYTGRTGDLLRLPKEVAHRTYSGDGRRRIGLEIMPRNPYWARLGESPIASDTSRRAGGLAFEIHEAAVEISWPGGALRTPRGLFERGLHALCAYELHLGHNEFDGGFIVHDLGERVRLKTPGHAETLDGRDVLAVFHGLRDELTGGG
ncbi:hypothetical protein E1293_18885 [Actinomadura darangshiensis]|uniref:Cupin domain-containing protein n=1 Tax=Actinomadura darangshiensis TaxID=705336 RepID=A0A4R5B513_9ACTN|nr:hypothetical protein [Actinomadura darangshiensis]TDD81338.1 hypothetical protein E1293_18885 [Actinomadura darangshiensis]